MNSAPGNGGGLEDRLRNLILSNSENIDPQPSPTAAAASSGPASSPMMERPDDQGGTHLPSPLGKDLLDTERGPTLSDNIPKASRKRMNQAQRRQMSAQLSIPIDPRPPPPPSHSARQYASPPAYPNSHYPHSQQKPQHPQSATFRPTHHTHATNPSYPYVGSHYQGQHRHHQSWSHHGSGPYNGHHDWRAHSFARQGEYSQNAHHGPNSSFDAQSPRSVRNSNAALYNPGRQYLPNPEEMKTQASVLESLSRAIISNAEIEPAEIQEKERFRTRVEQICRDAITDFEIGFNSADDFLAASVQLKCFGSLSSGFATKASDMDLGLLSPLSRCQPDEPESPIPRLIEKALLDAGYGARLLTRTRVPIIKLCETPPQKLKLDLLEERTRWEKGIHADHDGHDAEEDAVDDLDVIIPPASTSAGEAKRSHQHVEPGLHVDAGPEDYKHKLARLKQSEKQQLPGYYGLAKRLLRRLGGHDITISSAKDFVKKDLQLVTDVSEAFVHGLADDALKTRLLAKVSLAFPTTSPLPHYRSLAGVHTQIEGENMAMIWDQRQVSEKDEHQEREASNRVKLWNEVQNKSTFGLDPVAYNRELQLALEYLKRIPSIQIILLEQGQYESPTQYHARTMKVLLELGGYDRVSGDSKALTVATVHYIKGIWNEEIRNQVADFAESTKVSSLRAVARRHKSLQLAWEFERALEKGLYDEADMDDVKTYVTLLRGPLTESAGLDQHFDVVIPNTPELSPLISRVRQLTDPSKMAPNQPRDPYRDRLEFPKTGVGVQCDINFSPQLALQNTLLLRCYSRTDPRVRPLVLFVKHWAKVRGVNTAYRGTLSSYGYVLMVLHYLVNVAQPFVCPNLQQVVPALPSGVRADQTDESLVCKGRNVHFWRDEAEIDRQASQGSINQNHDSVGLLLRGFFEYYANTTFMTTVPSRGFDWGRDVLSLRTPGGLRSKQDKGWTGAKTVLEMQHQDSPMTPSKLPLDAEGGKPADGSNQTNKPTAPPKAVEMKEVRHRYLFAIEDPFELDHNVARTVTHNGIVSIRDEFRRAWRIIRCIGSGPQEPLLKDAGADVKMERDLFAELLDEIHGREVGAV